MTRNFLVFGICMILGMFDGYAQNPITSYILQIEGNKIYLDVTVPKAKVGDVLSVYSEAGYMIHPVTKQKIQKEGEILADLEIIEVKKEYSIASVYPEDAISKMKVGMIASMPEVLEEVVADVFDENIDTYKSNYNPVFNTPSDVIRWHYECTGMNKFKNASSYALLEEKIITQHNKKGKIESTVHSTVIIHPSLQKGYVKTNTKYVALGPDIEISVTCVVNGNIGWEKINKGKTKEMKDKRLMQMKDALQNGLDQYLTNRYTTQLLGYQYIDNKECIGIRIDHMKEGNITKNFYDIENGLLVASYVTLKGKDENIARVKEYQNFNGVMMPSIIETVDEKGRMTVEKIIRHIPNYPLDNITFIAEDNDRNF